MKLRTWIWKQRIRFSRELPYETNNGGSAPSWAAQTNLVEYIRTLPAERFNADGSKLAFELRKKRAFAEAAEVYEIIGDRRNAVDAYLYAASNCLKKSNLENAIKYFDKALRLGDFRVKEFVQTIWVGGAIDGGLDYPFEREYQYYLKQIKDISDAIVKVKNDPKFRVISESCQRELSVLGEVRRYWEERRWREEQERDKFKVNKPLTFELEVAMCTAMHSYQVSFRNAEGGRTYIGSRLTPEGEKRMREIRSKYGKS